MTIAILGDYMKTMSAAHFKSQCLKVMDEVHKSRQEVVITKRGKPVARLAPLKSEPDDIFNCLAGEMEIVGDITSPVVPAEDWDVLK